MLDLNVTYAELTRNSSEDERANVNFLYDYIVHALGNKKEKDKTNS